MIYLLLIYPVFVIIIFLVLNKFWGKRNYIILNIFYALTLLIFVPFELLYWKFLRAKYNNKTKIILKELNELGLKYHIVFGTFLFAYRDGNFRDTDIDICVYRNEFGKKQIELIKSLGFVLKEQWKLDGEICEQTYINTKHHISMDIFHIGHKKEFAPTFDEKNGRYARRPKSYLYSRKKYNFNGIIVYAPSNPEEYLKWNYGKWNNKDTNYHWLFGSSSYPNFIVNNANIEYKKIS